MECKLSSSSGPWSCQIYIREEFDENNKRKAQLTRTPFGPQITQKAKVEAALRRAQAAILNPSVPIHEVLKTDLENLKNLSRQGRPLSFSRNVVEVELEGPELTDLSFIDLPGLSSLTTSSSQELTRVSRDHTKCRTRSHKPGRRPSRVPHQG
jgi:hypothetical protein